VSRDIRLVSEDGEMTAPPPPAAIDLASEEKPFLEMGYTIGRLLEDAHRAADELKRSAEQEAAVLVQEANRNATRMKEDAERQARQVRSEAQVVLDDARTAAARINDQVAHEKRLAEAEASVIRREAQREAKMIKDKAQREADAVVAEASARSVDRVRELEHRLRSLQHAEGELERRIARLRSMHRSMQPSEERLAAEPSPDPN
jgi:cell division septum initiation protein DivIVA